MNSNIKFNSFIDIEELNSRDQNEAQFFIKRSRTFYKILHRFLKEGNKSITSIAENLARRATDNRMLHEPQTRISDAIDENGKLHNGSKTKSGPLLSGLAYCISSCSMILLNKVVLSGYGFDAGVSLMLYQNFVSVMIILAMEFLGAVSTEKLTWKLVRVWIPVNLIFVGMLVTGMYSLKHINVAMVTILKNMTNILTAFGETYLFKKRQNGKVWAALFLMIVSAVSGGITDLSFDAVGYTWQFMNCVLTAGYSLILRQVMDTAKQSTKSGSLNEVSMVLLNNSLSVPFGIVLIVLFDEWGYVYKSEVIRLPTFWVAATVSGLLGLALNFTSMWFLNQTGPTTYSLVGSLNKIPISICGILLFKVPVSLTNLLSILFGLFAGVFFAKAKMS
ncbi:putative sugar phosphate transporter domain-containing protein [Dioscorea sansibarensis]